MLDNAPLKLLSLGLSVVLWFAIAGEKTSEMGLRVPLELQNFPREMELTGEPANSVEVRLRASPGVIERLGPGEVSARVNLTGFSEGEHIVHLASDAVRVPFGVKVVRINPSILTLNLERTLHKTVPIRPRLLGRPAPGFEVAEVRAMPPRVEMAGPRSRIQPVESAFTEPVSVEGARSTVVAEVTVGLEDPVLRIQGSPRVEVTAEIREAFEKRSFPNRAVAVRGRPARLVPAAVSIVLTGPPAILAAMDPEAVLPYVDLTETSPKGRAKVAVAVELAGSHPGVAVYQVDPPEVTASPLRRRP